MWLTLDSTSDVSNTHYGSDKCPTRHTGAAFHASSNRVDVPPRSIPVGLPEMVDAKHRLVHHQIQLPVYYSQILYVDTLVISEWYWMHTPICLPYSSQESYSGSKNSAAHRSSWPLCLWFPELLFGIFHYTTSRGTDFPFQIFLFSVFDINKFSFFPFPFYILCSTDVFSIT